MRQRHDHGRSLLTRQARPGHSRPDIMVDTGAAHLSVTTMGSGDAVGGESTDYKQGQQLLQQQGWHRAVEVGLKQTFLPAGYPASVQPTFFTYCQWQFLHMATGSAAGVLSMQALLYAAGLGAGAVPLAAAINWVLKDGLGQLGGVLCVPACRYIYVPTHRRLYSRHS